MKPGPRHRQRHLIWLFTGACILTSSSCGVWEGGTSKAMQDDFDCTRLKDLVAIANLMHEYQEETHHFPFDDPESEEPVVVIVGSHAQIKRDDNRIPIVVDLKSRQTGNTPLRRPPRVQFRSLQELKQELETGVGRSVEVPIDPQKVPVNKPSMYVYTCYRGVFDVTAFLHNEFPFARQMSPHNYKVSIGSRSNPESAIWTVDELTSSRAFVKATER